MSVSYSSSSLFHQRDSSVNKYLGCLAALPVIPSFLFPFPNSAGTMGCTMAPCLPVKKKKKRKNLLGTIECFYDLSHQDSLLWPDVYGNRLENDFLLVAVLQIYSFKEQTCHKDFPLRRHPHVCSESDSGYHVVRDSLHSHPVFPETPKVLRNEYGSYLVC